MNTQSALPWSAGIGRHVGMGQLHGFKPRIAGLGRAVLVARAHDVLVIVAEAEEVVVAEPGGTQGKMLAPEAAARGT